MLTIQPNFTHYSAKNLAFKGEDPELNEDTYREKRRFYKEQKEEFEDMMNDEYTSTFGKKIMKAGKIGAEGILEGWAVLWGATKGAKMLKTFKNGKFVNGTKDVLRPMKAGIKEAAKKFGKVISDAYSNFTSSKFVTKLDNSKYGHYVVEAFRYIGKGFKALGSTIKKGWELIAKPFKKVTYNDAAKATATTLGVGAGIGGAYSASRGESKKEARVRERNNNYDDDIAEEFREVDKSLEDEDVDLDEYGDVD